MAALPGQETLPCLNTDKYRSVEMIGKGTFGEVSKAEVVQSKRAHGSDSFVAIKKLRFDRKADGVPMHSLREIKILQRLRHKNIIGFREIMMHADALKSKEQSEYLSLVFDYADHDLAGLLKRQHAFDVREIMCLTHQLMEGLEYLHASHIIHRDLKTANVLVCRRGVLRIADFGFARIMEEHDGRYSLPVCSRWYRPPEALLRIANYTFAVDMWSAGCIVAELFTGDPLFKAGVAEHSDDQNDIDQFLMLCEHLGCEALRQWNCSLPFPIGMEPKKEYPCILPQTLSKKFLAAHKPSTKSAVDLVCKLLLFNPTQRLSASDALAHAFLSGACGERACRPAEIKLPEGEYHESKQSKPERRR